MTDKPRSIYARMRTLILLEGEDPFNEDRRKRAAELKQTESELLEHYRNGYITDEECLIALVRAALTHAPLPFYTYRDAWRTSPGFSCHKVAANALIVGDNSHTPVAELQQPRPVCAHPDISKLPEGHTLQCPVCKQTFTRPKSNDV